MRYVCNGAELRAAREAGTPPEWIVLVCARCLCGIDEPQYMVEDEVWADARGLLGPGGYLHLRCLAESLGRPLTLDDFTDAPVNALLRYGATELARQRSRG